MLKTCRRLLLDVDGPLTEGFIDYVCARLWEHGITAYAHAVDNWDQMASFNTPDHVRKVVNETLTQPNVALSFEPRADAMEFVSWAREHAAVYAVTSQWDAPHWTYERTQWLRTRLAFHLNQIVHAHDKFVVSGDVLVDDKPENVTAWQASHPDGLAVLWRMGHNRTFTWNTEVKSLTELRQLLTLRWKL